MIIPARSSTARKRLADSREEPASCARSAWVAVITTSPSPAPSVRAPPATSSASTAATRLCTVWNDWRASRSLVSRSRRPSAAISFTAMSGCSRSSRRMSRAEDRDRLRLLDRLDRRRAPLVVEHRQLAEDVTRAEVGECDRATVGMLADRRVPSRAHDVARVALVALAEHDLARVEATGHRHLGHALELLAARASRTPARGAAARSCPRCSQTSSQGYHTPARVSRSDVTPASRACSRRRRCSADPIHHTSAATSADRRERRERDQRHAGRDRQHAAGVVRGLADGEAAAAVRDRAPAPPALI